MREIISMIVVLSCICGISGLGLSYLKDATKPLIEEQVLTYVQSPAIERVFADADNDPVAERQKFELDGKEITVFPAMKNGKLTAVALEASGPGYGGNIGVMVGFDIATDTLVGIGITTLSETPGLGMRVTEPKYEKQFKGINPLEVALSSNGGSIDAISGATISSAGTVTAVSKAAEMYQKLKEQIQTTWNNS